MTSLTIGLAAAAAWCIAAASPAIAQLSTESDQRAAFIRNFAKFAEWPHDSRDPRVFMFCIIGDPATAASLERSLRQRPAPLAISVAKVKPEDAPGACQLIYATGLDTRQKEQLLNRVNGRPVFTVSDAAGFAEQGGVAQLFVEGGRMRFAINQAAAHRAHLALSAQLLTLATLVKDGHAER